MTLIQGSSVLKAQPCARRLCMDLCMQMCKGKAKQPCLRLRRQRLEQAVALAGAALLARLVAVVPEDLLQ